MIISEAPPKLGHEDRKALALIERIKKLKEKPPQSQSLPRRKPPQNLAG